MSDALDEALQAILDTLDRREQELSEALINTREGFFWTRRQARREHMQHGGQGDRKVQLEPKVTRSERTRLGSVGWNTVTLRGKGLRPISKYLRRGKGPMYTLATLVQKANPWEREPVVRTEVEFAKIRAEAAALHQIRQTVRQLEATLSKLDKEGEAFLALAKTRGITG